MVDVSNWEVEYWGDDGSKNYQVGSDWKQRGEVDSVFGWAQAL